MFGAKSVLAAVLLAIVSVAGADWDYSWQASSDLRPDQTTPAFARHGYQVTDPLADNYTGIVTDAISGQDALTMVHGSTNGYYNMTSGPAVGTASDNMRIEFDVRILDTTETKPQLRFLVCRPTEVEDQCQRADLRFFKNYIGYYDGATQLTKAIDLTVWHDIVLTFNAVSQTGAIYIDGSETPFVTFSSNIVTGTSNYIQFGDGSSVFAGTANMSYLQWTNSIPEPATISFVVIGGIAILGRKRANFVLKK